MIKVGDVTDENLKKIPNLNAHSWSSTQNINNWRFWIMKKRCIT